MFSLQNRTRVQVWLYENINTRIEGHIVGFDEYMNLVLDDAAEVIVVSHTNLNQYYLIYFISFEFH